MLITLLYSVAGGMLTILSTAKLRQIAWRFLRLIGILTLALACGPTIWKLRESGWANLTPTSTITLGLAASVAAASLLLFASLAQKASGLMRIICFIGGVAGIAAAVRSSLAITNHLPPTFVLVLFICISQVLSSLFLGSITIAWLLGHAYLTATKMTIAPLRHFSRALSITTGLRVLSVIIIGGLGIWSMHHHAPSLTQQLVQNWIVASVRIGVGLVGAAIFAYMVADCVRLRATQSATGILYFGSIFAYVGELAGQYLLYETGWPM